MSSLHERDVCSSLIFSFSFFPPLLPSPAVSLYPPLPPSSLFSSSPSFLASFILSIPSYPLCHFLARSNIVPLSTVFPYVQPYSILYFFGLFLASIPAALHSPCHVQYLSLLTSSLHTFFLTCLHLCFFLSLLSHRLHSPHLFFITPSPMSVYFASFHLVFLISPSHHFHPLFIRAFLTPFFFVIYEAGAP